MNPPQLAGLALRKSRRNPSGERWQYDLHFPLVTIDVLKYKYNP